MNWGSGFFLEDIRMNWKIYEWILVQIFFWRGKYTNELEDIRMNWGSDFFLEDIRMNCGSDFFWRGKYTNELEDIRMNWGSDFFWIINMYFIFSIGGLGFWNPKIYEWIGRYTNELGFSFFLEDMRMNWKIYEWIVVQIFFGGEKKRMNWNIYEWIGVQIFFRIINIYCIFRIGGLGFWNPKIYEWIGRYTNELGFRFFFGRYTIELEDIRMNCGSDFFWRGKYTNELEDIRMNWGSDFFGNNKYLFYI